MSIVYGHTGMNPHSTVETYSYVNNMVLNLDDGTGSSTHTWFIAGHVYFSSSGYGLKLRFHSGNNANGSTYNAISSASTNGYYSGTSGGRMYYSGTGGNNNNYINGMASPNGGNSFSQMRGMGFWMWVHPHAHYGNGEGRPSLTGYACIATNRTGSDAFSSGDFWMISDTLDTNNNNDFSSLQLFPGTGQLSGSVRAYRWGSY